MRADQIAHDLVVRPLRARSNIAAGMDDRFCESEERHDIVDAPGGRTSSRIARRVTARRYRPDDGIRTPKLNPH
jgi:hypothetical protein